MKVAVIGTHGSGKTTIVKKLHKELSKKHKASKIIDIERKCPFPLNKNSSEKTQLWICTNFISEELSALNKNDIVIVDAGILTANAYVTELELNSEILDNIAKHWIKTYDLIFKTFPNENCFKNDGIRAMDKDYRIKIENLLLDFLKKNNINYHQLPEDTIDYNRTIDYIKEAILTKKV